MITLHRRLYLVITSHCRLYLVVTLPRRLYLAYFTTQTLHRRLYLAIILHRRLYLVVTSHWILASRTASFTANLPSPKDSVKPKGRLWHQKVWEWYQSDYHSSRYRPIKTATHPNRQAYLTTTEQAVQALRCDLGWISVWLFLPSVLPLSPARILLSLTVPKVIFFYCLYLA